MTRDDCASSITVESAGLSGDAFNNFFRIDDGAVAVFAVTGELGNKTTYQLRFIEHCRWFPSDSQARFASKTVPY